MKPLLNVVLASLLVACNVANAQDQNSWASTEKTKFKPKIHHANIKSVSLFAANPEIVTPVGIAVAPDGRVFVQENHTHKRNSDYNGPKTDRILIFEDQDKDGIADKRSVFYEGHTFSTDLLFGHDGHLYVSTRWFIGRFRNAATAGKADGEPEKIIVCETDGKYPHNGVGGLAIDPANPEWLAFGFGENLGADYTFVGSDGVKLSGGGEGGSTYLCRTDGSKLIRQSTGHWNAFGMAYDLSGNLFSTDNDPNATPPNRLLHIVPGADFGYEYRYGRSGRHPLTCWHGENPGTLGMIGALGEAASGLIPHGPGTLLSASWTDNRVDLHSLTAEGESFTATREPFLSGPDDFRPVHFAYSADGRYLYFTDWVKLSYPVHGHGRIWRVEFKQPVSLEPSKDRPATKELSTREALAKLGSSDPYTRTAAINVLAKQPNVLTNYKWQRASGIARAHYAVALKRSKTESRTDVIPTLLADEDSNVRYVGIKWIADEKLVQFEPGLKAVLDRIDLNRRDLLATVAALARISGQAKKGRKKEFSPSDTLLELALDAAKPPSLRAMALANVKIDHPKLTVAALAPLANSNHPKIQREAVHSLVIHGDANRAAVLAKVATDSSVDENLRADAIAGLASVAKGQEDLLEKLSSDESLVIAKEAKRTLVAAGLAQRQVETKPKADQIGDWIALVDREAVEEPDKAVGRRLFFHPALASCYKCHAIHGRGSTVGPDLTSIHNQTGVTRNWLLEHIVNPNAEMAPYYRPQKLLTADGDLLVGLVVGQEGQKQAYVSSDGNVFFVDKDDVEERSEMSISIMPEGLCDALSASEIRHLIAFLLSNKTQSAVTVSKNSQMPPHSPQKKENDRVIADFEGDNALEGKKTSHKATVSLVHDVPKGGGKLAAKTVIDTKAGTKQFFGVGFAIPEINLLKVGEISFWIKADFESGFSLQLTSAPGNTSVFPFSTAGSAGKWKQIAIPMSKLSKPRWGKAKADLTAINFIQITAFGSPPYDGKTILLDQFVTGALNGASAQPAESVDAEKSAILQMRAARLREPKILKSGEPVDMFDGKTLGGWKTIPRLYVPQGESFANMPADQLFDEVVKFYTENEGGRRVPNKERVKNRGVWEFKNGAVIGGQIPGSIAGSYLISEKTYGDFEMTLEANPDFPIDTGIMVRAHQLGSVGYQVLIDNRPNGSIGGVFGNSVGSFLAYPFLINGDEEPGNRIDNLREGDTSALNARGGQFKSDYSGTFAEFKEVWKPNAWNKIKVRCSGRLPLIETWINGVIVSRVDTATLADVVPGYDADAIFNLIGRKGHIAFEVHDSPTRERWAPGAKCRWRNVKIRELVCEEADEAGGSQ